MARQISLPQLRLPRSIYLMSPTLLNTPLNLGILNGTNGGIGLQGPQPTTNINWPSIALIDINNDGNLDMAIGMPTYSPTPALN